VWRGTRSCVRAKLARPREPPNSPTFTGDAPRFGRLVFRLHRWPIGQPSPLRYRGAAPLRPIIPEEEGKRKGERREDPHAEGTTAILQREETARSRLQALGRRELDWHYGSKFCYIPREISAVLPLALSGGCRTYVWAQDHHRDPSYVHVSLDNGISEYANTSSLSARSSRIDRD